MILRIVIKIIVKRTCTTFLPERPVECVPDIHPIAQSEVGRFERSLGRLIKTFPGRAKETLFPIPGH